MAPQPHAIIDDKSYPVYLNGMHRDHAARRSARGSYRSRKGGLCKGHVKPRKSQTGWFGKSALVMAAVIGSKTRARHEMGSWGGEAAASAYKGPMETALARSYPGRRSHTVLEDNAPSGYKSGAGICAACVGRVGIVHTRDRRFARRAELPAHGRARGVLHPWSAARLVSNPCVDRCNVQDAFR